MPSTSDVDKLKSHLIDFIRKTIGFFIVPSVDHLASYPCVVIVQHSDGTLDLQPDDKRLAPSYTNVPIYYGVPGIKATVPAKSRVTISWLGGNPRKPIASLWEMTTTITLKLGGPNATEQLVKGSSYATHMGQAVTAAQALQASITPLMLPPSAAAAKAALTQLITALQALQADVSSSVFTT